MTQPHTPDLGDNLSTAAAALGGSDEYSPPLPAAKPARAARAAASRSTKASETPNAPAAHQDTEQRVWIMLEDNEQIPPGGQFVGVNGKGYLLQPGVEMHVPTSVVDVLDHAVMSVPVKDAYDSVIGYRDRLRFPYRVLTKRRGTA